MAFPNEQVSTLPPPQVLTCSLPSTAGALVKLDPGPFEAACGVAQDRLKPG